MNGVDAIGAIGSGGLGMELATLRAGGALDREQRDFATLLATAERRVASGEADAEATARDAAERFVAQALVQPMLDMAREASEAAPPFHQTRAEKQFGSLLDAQVAVDVVRRSEWAVVERITSDLLRRGGSAEGTA